MNETWPEIKKRKLKERRGETFDWIQSLVVALFACVLIFTFLVRVVGVVGTSMHQHAACPATALLRLANLFYQTPKARRHYRGCARRAIEQRADRKARDRHRGTKRCTIDFAKAASVYVDGVALG